MEKGDDVNDVDDNLPWRAFMTSTGEQHSPTENISHKIVVEEEKKGRISTPADKLGLTLKKFYHDPVVSFARMVAGGVGSNNLDVFMVSGNTVLRDMVLSLVRRGCIDIENLSYTEVDDISGFSIITATETFYAPKLYAALQSGMMMVKEINGNITLDDILRGGDSTLMGRFAQYVSCLILMTQNLAPYGSRKYLINELKANIQEARIKLKKSIQSFNRRSKEIKKSGDPIDIDDL
jgi:hypothetical protein